MEKQPSKPDKAALNHLFRGVSVVIPKEAEARKKLTEGKKPLRVKYGIDPTTPDLHMGYLVIFRKLKLLKKLGHQVVILFGGFTARFGDPTDKTESRGLRDKASVREAMHGYQKELTEYFGTGEDGELDIEFRDNSEWYDKMSAEDLLKLMSETTVAQMLERDMFRERMNAKKPIGLHEPTYPLLQGYDSVRLESDMTVIGSDQMFNENAARPLQERAGQSPQVVIGCEMIPGTDGGEKMSQSLGNAILMNEAPEEQFGKLMSLTDEAAVPYARMLTNLEMDQTQKDLSGGGGEARDAKLLIAETIVKELRGDAAAAEAKKQFLARFQSGAASVDDTTTVNRSLSSVADVLVAAGATPSKSEAKRAIKQGGVRIDGKAVEDPQAKVPKEKEFVLEKGKRWRKKIQRV